jgi:hypothetical protein
MNLVINERLERCSVIKNNLNRAAEISVLAQVALWSAEAETTYLYCLRHNWPP